MVTMEYDITGDNLQIVTLRLSEGERVYAEAGAMNHMSDNIQMEAKVRGGLLKGLMRKLAGESLFMTEFTPRGGPGYVAFAGNVPGKIKPIALGGGSEFIAQKDAFLCAESGVNLEITFTKRLGAGFFGGEGFILEKLSGDGVAFIHACGDFVEMELKAGEVIKVDTGSVVGFDASVEYDITTAGGIKSMLFGGEGIFLTRLRGPGRVILQSLSLANLAAALFPHMPLKQGGTSGGRGIGLGTLLGD